MFSPKLMRNIFDDLDALNQKTYSTRVFQTLYQQSYLFYVYQSYVQYSHLIQYVYEITRFEEQNPDLNRFITEFNAFHDLRTCECVDDVMTVYLKLVDYHTTLYDMYEKIVDDKRDSIRIKQFDRIMYYRVEICQLLLRINCLQRLFVEIENGRKFIEKFQNETNSRDDSIFQFRYLLLKYTYDFFQASFLQRTRAFQDAKQLCEQSLKELNEAYQEKIWDKLLLTRKPVDLPEKEKRHLLRHHTENHSKQSSVDFNHNIQSSAATTVSNNLLS